MTEVPCGAESKAVEFQERKQLLKLGFTQKCIRTKLSDLFQNEVSILVKKIERKT